MILKFCLRLFSLFIQSAMKFKLNLLALSIALSLYSIFTSMLPSITSNAFKSKSFVSIMLFILCQAIRNIYPQIKHIFTYKIINSIIKDYKNWATKSYIRKDNNTKSLGQIKRMPEHVHKLIHTLINIFLHLSIIITQGFILRNANIFSLIVIIVAYISLFCIMIYGWIPLLKNSYFKDNNAHFKSITALKYNNHFFNSNALFEKEVSHPINEEYNAYNSQSFFIRIYTLIITAFLYSCYATWVCIYFDSLTFVYILSSLTFVHYIIKFFNLIRLIVGLLYGIHFNIVEEKECANIEFCSIDIESLYFKYKNIVLNNLSLSILPNKWTRIIGENGAGKTTLCKIISGALLPHEGMVQNGTFVLNKNNQFNWKKNVFYKPKDLKVFEYELSELKKCKIWMSYFSNYSHLLDQSDFSEGENNFLSISALIIYPKPWFVILDECLDCIDKEKMEKLEKFMKNNFPTLIFTSQNNVPVFDNIISLQRHKID